jgi:hypothetical protein
MSVAPGHLNIKGGRRPSAIILPFCEIIVEQA